MSEDGTFEYSTTKEEITGEDVKAVSVLIITIAMLCIYVVLLLQNLSVGTYFVDYPWHFTKTDILSVIGHFTRWIDTRIVI